MENPGVTSATPDHDAASAAAFDGIIKITLIIH